MNQIQYEDIPEKITNPDEADLYYQYHKQNPKGVAFYNRKGAIEVSFNGLARDGTGRRFDIRLLEGKRIPYMCKHKEIPELTIKYIKYLSLINPIINYKFYSEHCDYLEIEDCEDNVIHTDSLLVATVYGADYKIVMRETLRSYLHIKRQDLSDARKELIKLLKMGKMCATFKHIILCEDQEILDFLKSKMLKFEILECRMPQFIGSNNIIKLIFKGELDFKLVQNEYIQKLVIKSSHMKNFEEEYYSKWRSLTSIEDFDSDFSDNDVFERAIEIQGKLIKHIEKIEEENRQHVAKRIAH